VLTDDGYNDTRSFPEQDLIYETYVKAFRRVCVRSENDIAQAPITEMRCYFEHFCTPFSFEFFVDAMRFMENVRLSVKPISNELAERQSRKPVKESNNPESKIKLAKEAIGHSD